MRRRYLRIAGHSDDAITISQLLYDSDVGEMKLIDSREVISNPPVTLHIDGRFLVECEITDGCWWFAPRLMEEGKMLPPDWLIEVFSDTYEFDQRTANDYTTILQMGYPPGVNLQVTRAL